MLMSKPGSLRADAFQTLPEFAVAALGALDPSQLGPDPDEQHWQMEFYKAMCTILPIGTHVQVNVGSSFGSPGRLDFRVNGTRQWAIELLVNGDRMKEHIQRFEEGGIYHEITTKEKLILDFRTIKQSGVRKERPDWVWHIIFNQNLPCITIKRAGHQDISLTLKAR